MANVDEQKSTRHAPSPPANACGLPGHGERSSQQDGVAGRAGAGAPGVWTEVLVCLAAQWGWTVRAGLPWALHLRGRCLRGEGPATRPSLPCRPSMCPLGPPPPPQLPWKQPAQCLRYARLLAPPLATACLWAPPTPGPTGPVPHGLSRPPWTPDPGWRPPPPPAAPTASLTSIASLLLFSASPARTAPPRDQSFCLFLL